MLIVRVITTRLGCGYNNGLFNRPINCFVHVI